MSSLNHKKKKLMSGSPYYTCGSQKVFKKSCVYVSYADDQRRSFKVAVHIYHEWITKEEVLKLRCLYTM